MRGYAWNMLLLGTASICLCGSPAFAQSDQSSTVVAQNTTPTKPQAAPKAGDQIETVTVTANRRVEDIQKVGVAITAFDGSTLNQQGIVGFQDLSQRVPDLRFGSGVTGGENVITLRGVGSQNTTPGGDSPVAYSVDGVTLQRTTAIDPEFYDISAVEVDEGPQGTLDGRNSVGGSIRITTNRPTDEFSGGLDAAIGDYSARIFRGYANVPLINNNDAQVNLRITGVDAQHDGYVTNVSQVPGATHNLDGEDLQTFRGQLDIRLNSDVELLLEAFTLHNNDPVATKVQFWETPARFTGQTFYSSPWVVDNDYPDIGVDRLNLYIANLSWNLGWATLTNIFGYETSYHDSSNDGDGTGLPLAYNGDWLLKQQQISNEIRLVSSESATDPLRWVTGVYFFQAQNYENFDFVDTGYNSPGSPGAPCALFSPGCLTYTFFSHGNLSSRSLAPYGQVDFDLMKTSIGIPLTVTAGLRYTDDEKYGSGELFYDTFPVVAPKSTHNWGQWTGKFELAYQLTPDIMGYASVSRGYLSGGNIIGLASFYTPEHVWSYEAGEKAELFDNHLQLDVSLYREDLVNMQVFIQSGPNSVLENAAAAHVNGLELQAIVIPIDGLRANVALAVTDGKYDTYLSDDNRFSGPGPGCNAITLQCSFAGHYLNQTPPYTFNLGLEYNWETSIGTITPRVDTFWSGFVYFLPDNFNRQSAYNVTDLNLMWTDLSGKYSVEAFVRNVGNSVAISNDGLQSISFGNGLQEPDNYTYYPPRTFGVRFAVKF